MSAERAISDYKARVHGLVSDRQRRLNELDQAVTCAWARVMLRRNDADAAFWIAASICRELFGTDEPVEELRMSLSGTVCALERDARSADPESWPVVDAEWNKEESDG